jgi:hypothetical protein
MKNNFTFAIAILFFNKKSGLTETALLEIVNKGRKILRKI